MLRILPHCGFDSRPLGISSPRPPSGRKAHPKPILVKLAQGLTAQRIQQDLTAAGTYRSLAEFNPPNDSKTTRLDSLTTVRPAGSPAAIKVPPQSVFDIFDVTAFTPHACKTRASQLRSPPPQTLGEQHCQ